MARHEQQETVVMTPSLFLNTHWYLLTLICIPVVPLAIFFGIISFFRTIYILTWTYTFYDTHLIEEKGILVRSSTQVDFTRIRTVRSDSHILMMMVGIGNVSMATSDVYVPELVLWGVDNYREIEEIITDECLNNRRSNKRVDIDNFNFS
jgi:uncharacterized membrane protein YdbT with pleckstrin-like domain